MLFSELAGTRPTSAVEDSLAKITGDTVAKLMLTSGSTGMPKVVINTQRMMCANVTMGQQTIVRDPDKFCRRYARLDALEPRDGWQRRF